MMGRRTWVLDPYQTKTMYKVNYFGASQLCPETFNESVKPGEATRFEYDKLGRQIRYYKPGHTSPDSEKFFTPGGMLDHIVDSQGKTASYTYDGFGRVQSVSVPAYGEYPSKTVTFSSYNEIDKPERIDDGETWVEYDYDTIKGLINAVRTGGVFADGLELPETELSFMYNEGGQREMVAERYRFGGGAWQTPFGMNNGSGQFATGYQYDRYGRFQTISQSNGGNEMRKLLACLLAESWSCT